MDKENEKKGYQAESWLIVLVRLLDMAEQLIKAGTWITLGYFALEAIRTLAGKTTVVSMILSVLGQPEVTEILKDLVVFGSIVWALLERRERRRKTEYLSSRLGKLEATHDPARTSSNISPDGTTNPADRP